MKQKVFVIVFVIVSALLLSCGSTRQVTQLVEHVQKDTVYLSNIKYDSIYVYQDKYVDRSRDTIYIKDKSIEYRYKMLRDTVRIVQRDSIPYEVTIVETKEIVRPLTWFDRVSRAITIAIAIALVAYLAYKSRRLFLYVLKVLK